LFDHQHEEIPVCVELSCQGGTEGLLTPFSWWCYYTAITTSS